MLTSIIERIAERYRGQRGFLGRLVFKWDLRWLRQMDTTVKREHKMNRRTFFQITGAAVGTGAAAGSVLASNAPSGSTKYGLMTVDRCMRLRKRGLDLRCFLDGVDVSDHCQLAHDIEGWAVLYRQNAKGYHYVDPDTPFQVAMETRYGVVEFRRA